MKSLFAWLGLAFALTSFSDLVSVLCLAQDEGKMLRAQLSDGVELVFASQEKGRKLLAQEDRFLEKMQPLERQIRLQSSEPVSQQQYLEQLQAGVLEWSQEDIDRMISAIEALRQPFAKFELPLPKEIYLTRVSKEVEGNAPHCRGANVVCPDRLLASGDKLDDILTHELFHVLSNHNPALRDRLYQVIGFQACNEIPLPEHLQRRRLTNPDAPSYQHYLEIDLSDEEQALVTPFILTKSDSYAPGGLFANLDLKLLVLERDGKDQLKVQLQDGEARLLGIAEAPDYLRKIGRNTNYIIHPEETLADNFVLLLLDQPAPQDPWVLEKMEAVLGNL